MINSISKYLKFSEGEIKEIYDWEKHQELRMKKLPEEMSSDLKRRLRLGIYATA